MVIRLLSLENVFSKDDSNIRLVFVKDPSHILQGQSPSLRVSEPHAKDHDDKNRQEDEIVFPLNGVESDRVDEGVEESEAERCHLDKSETLGAQLVRPDLDWVRNEKRSEGNVVAEEEAVQQFISNLPWPNESTLGDTYMKRNGMTASPVAESCVEAKLPDKPVITI